MKTFAASALAIAVIAGFAAAPAQANDSQSKVQMTRQTATSNTYTTRSGESVHMATQVGYDGTAHDPEAQKYIYNGSTAYRGGLAGQVASQDSFRDGDRRGFTVSPVRGMHNQFGASLRQGDTGQSDETRLNATFNN